MREASRRRSADQRRFSCLVAAGKNGNSPGAGDPAVCARFAPQGEALAKASGVLSAYFKALQQLASFNTSTVSSASEQTAENAATAANLSSTQMADVGKLAALVTQIFTARYQRRHLLEYLREADTSISSVTTGVRNNRVERL